MDQRHFYGFMPCTNLLEKKEDFEPKDKMGSYCDRLFRQQLSMFRYRNRAIERVRAIESVSLIESVKSGVK